jgi:hypothetical protein
LTQLTAPRTSGLAKVGHHGDRRRARAARLTRHRRDACSQGHPAPREHAARLERRQDGRSGHGPAMRDLEVLALVVADRRNKNVSAAQRRARLPVVEIRPNQVDRPQEGVTGPTEDLEVVRGWAIGIGRRNRTAMARVAAHRSWEDGVGEARPTSLGQLFWRQSIRRRRSNSCNGRCCCDEYHERCTNRHVSPPLTFLARGQGLYLCLSARVSSRATRKSRSPSAEASVEGVAAGRHDHAARRRRQDGRSVHGCWGAS